MIKESSINYDIKVPFDDDGDQIGYDWRGQCKDGRKNFIFDATMYLTGQSRGRSSIKFHFKAGIEGKEYEMFATDFAEMVKHHNVSGGITGQWCFRKRGANFGLVLIEGTIIDTQKECAEAYQELLYAVVNKIPGETRHQTALRIITDAEAPECNTPECNAHNFNSSTHNLT